MTYLVSEVDITRDQKPKLWPPNMSCLINDKLGEKEEMVHSKSKSTQETTLAGNCMVEKTVRSKSRL